MTQPGGNVAKQQIVGLRCREVSVVDEPANEEYFLTLKNRDGASMNDKNAAPTTTTQPAAKADVKCAKCGAMVKEGAEKCSECGAMMSEKSEKADTTQAAAPPAASAPVTGADLVKHIDSLTALLKTDGGLTEDARKSAVGLLDALQGLGIKVPSGIAPAVGMPSAPMQKGLKQLSRERLKQLRTAFDGLFGVMKDVDPDTVQAILQAMAPLEAVEEAPIDPATLAAPATKAVTPVALPPELTESLSKLTGELSNVNKRLEGLEKSQAVSKALNDNPAPQPAQGKTFWGGLL